MKFKHLNQDVIANAVKQSIVKDSLLSGLPRPTRGLAMTPGSESGRSMVEMLGVLAIMGILTIGGIAGFNYAMDKSKANDILDGVNKRAIALSTYTMLGTNITSTTLNAEFSNRIGDSTVALDADNTGFDLIVSGVSEAVCDHVLNNGAKMASEILLKEGEDDRVVWKQGVKSDHTCAETDNEIVFAFNASLDGTKRCGYCQHKENNTCVADKTCDNGCPGDKPMKIGIGACYSCDSSLGFSINATECAHCSNRFMTTNGYCTSCDSLDSSADATECAKCPNRFRTTDGYCRACDTSQSYVADATECAKCPNREMLDGKCAQICTEGQFRNSYGSCLYCSVSSSFDADAAECAKCSNRFMATNGYCVSCNNDNAYKADAEECAKCPERKILNGKCVINECSDGQFRISYGSCRDCSDSTPYVADAAECAKCSNREMLDGRCVLKECPGGWFRTSYGSCWSCDSSTAMTADATECAKCSNRVMLDGECALSLSCTDGQFRNSAGNCQSCSSNSVVQADKAECDKCSNRFSTTDGHCYLCSYNSAVQADKIECDKCSNRVMLNGKCAKICADGQFRNSVGACVSCSLSRGAVSSDATECAKCPDREWLDNGYCCLKDKTKYTNPNVCKKCEGTWDEDNNKCS